MLTEERKTFLLDTLAIDGRIEAKAVAKELGLSDDTIRRDLRELAAAGKLQRVHGGALPTSPADADLNARKAIASKSKQEIGKTAASLIKPGQVVIIDGGTTALELTKNIPKNQENTVITHSPTVAVALAAHVKTKVIMIGGTLFRHSMVNVGAATVEAASRIRADFFFMGVTGVDINAGLSTGDMEEAHIKRALSQRAAETVVMASSEKIGVASTYVVMPLEQASGIVLGQNTPMQLRKDIKKLGLEVFVKKHNDGA